MEKGRDGEIVHLLVHSPIGHSSTPGWVSPKMGSRSFSSGFLMCVYGSMYLGHPLLLSQARYPGAGLEVRHQELRLGPAGMTVFYYF